LREIRGQGYTRPIVLLTDASGADIDIQALQAELLDRRIRDAIEHKKTEQEREGLVHEQLVSKELERKKHVSGWWCMNRKLLTSLKGLTRLLSCRMARVCDPSLCQSVSRRDAQSDKMTLLIHDLLDITSIEGGIFQLEDFFSFDAPLEEIIQLTNGSHILQREGQTVWGDRKGVGQVITNLLTNAIKHAPEARVRTRADAHTICCSMQDAGSGIAREKHTQIFALCYHSQDRVQRNTPGLLSIRRDHSRPARQNLGRERRG